VGVVRRKLIRALAERVLAEQGVRSGPVPVESIARSYGIQVSRQPAEDDLSGFLLRDKRNRRAVIGVNQDHSATRQRFTVGHELGHYLLHDSEPIHVDRANIGFQVKRRDALSSDGTDAEEKEANLFAAELLMPARLIEADVARLKEFSLLDEKVLTRLARQYEVSTQAISFRLAYLGFVEL